MHRIQLSLRTKLWSLCFLFLVPTACKTSQIKQSNIEGTRQSTKEELKDKIETLQAMRFELPVREGKRLSFKEQTLVRELFVMTSRLMVFKSRIVESKEYAGTKPRLKDLQKISRYNFLWSMLKLGNWLPWLNFDSDYSSPVIYSIAFKNKESQANYTLTLTRDSSTKLEITISGSYMPKFKSTKDTLNTENAILIKKFLTEQSSNVFRFLDSPLVEALTPLAETTYYKSNLDFTATPKKNPLEVLENVASLANVTRKQLRSRLEAFIYKGQINGLLTELWKDEYLKKSKKPDELVVSQWMINRVEQCAGSQQHVVNDFVETGIEQCILSLEGEVANALNKESTLFKTLSQQEFVPFEAKPTTKKPKKFSYSRLKKGAYLELAKSTLKTLREANFNQQVWTNIKQDYPISVAMSFKARPGSTIENSTLSIAFVATANSLNSYEDLSWPSKANTETPSEVSVKLFPRISNSGLPTPQTEVEKAIRSINRSLQP